MKRTFQLLVAFVLLGSLTIQADLGGWRPSTTYVNGQNIGLNDVQTFALYCNTTPEEFGPPYEVVFPNYNLTSDLTPSQKTLVHNFVAGTYWCAPTQFSTLYGTESGYGPELDFTVTVQTIGFVPNPPLAQ